MVDLLSLLARTFETGDGEVATFGRIGMIDLRDWLLRHYPRLLSHGGGWQLELHSEHGLS
jgi:hypothetical protein